MDTYCQLTAQETHFNSIYLTPTETSCIVPAQSQRTPDIIYISHDCCGLHPHYLPIILYQHLSWLDPTFWKNLVLPSR
jgi:hypothetical protein